MLAMARTRAYGVVLCVSGNFISLLFVTLVYNLQRSLKDPRSEEFILEVVLLPKVAPLPLPCATPKTNSSERESLNDCRTLYYYSLIMLH